MRAVAIVVALAFGYILFGQVGSGGGPPATPRFRLDAKSEMRAGAIRAYAESVYTLYETRGNGKEVERWRVTQQDKYAEHWISPSGTVWVKTDMVPGPGGGGGIWVRDASADIKGHFGVRGDIDVAGSKALQLKGGAEQLRLKHPDGSETRITVAQTDQGEVSVVRNVKKGVSDLLTEQLDQGYGPNEPVLRRFEGTPFVLWRFSGQTGPRYLRQIVERQFSQRSLGVRSETYVPCDPSAVARTPRGRIVWFEFASDSGPGKASLHVFNAKGELRKSWDLLAAGEFASDRDALRNIIVQDLMWSGGAGFDPMGTSYQSWSKERESVAFEDRLGRKYLVEFLGEGDEFSVVFKASMNLGRVMPKEPVLTDAVLDAEHSLDSPNGRFTASIKQFVRKGQRQSQITLRAQFDDPIEGSRKVELYSVPVPVELSEVKVSDSGRILATSYTRGQTAFKELGDRCLFIVWDPSGKSLAADLIFLKWFTNVDEARKTLSLKDATIILEGRQPDRLIEGLPVPLYRIETVGFGLGQGRNEYLYIGYTNDMLPITFYIKKPKI
jgi:hypothetical protein